MEDRKWQLQRHAQRERLSGQAAPGRDGLLCASYSPSCVTTRTCDMMPAEHTHTTPHQHHTTQLHPRRNQSGKHKRKNTGATSVRISCVWGWQRKPRMLPGVDKAHGLSLKLTTMDSRWSSVEVVKNSITL